jgi:hypothetical protein
MSVLSTRKLLHRQDIGAQQWLATAGLSEEAIKGPPAIAPPRRPSAFHRRPGDHDRLSLNGMYGY